MIPQGNKARPSNVLYNTCHRIKHGGVMKNITYLVSQCAKKSEFSLTVTRDGSIDSIKPPGTLYLSRKASCYPVKRSSWHLHGVGEYMHLQTLPAP